MAGKDFVNPFVLMTAGDMSGDLVSNSFQVTGFDNIGIQFIWTGTPEGDFAVEISLDNVNWTALPLSPAPAAAGSADNAYVELNQTTAKYIRCSYTATASTGTLTILISEKMV